MSDVWSERFINRGPLGEEASIAHYREIGDDGPITLHALRALLITDKADARYGGFAALRELRPDLAARHTPKEWLELHPKG